jgi:serine/threonine protein kinase
MPVIGSGSFGTIFHVRDRGNQRTFAVKVMARQHYEVRGMGKQISTEIQAMQRANKACSDPGWSRIVQLHGCQEENGFVFLMLELCVHGNLAQQLTNALGGLKEATAARCARHLFQGLRDIHAAGIIHRDIKPENLLITTNEVLKISDFGWAADTSEAPTGFAGTFETMAPEILKQRTHTTAVDMWSAGAVLYHMVTGKKLLRANIGNGATQLSVSDPQGAARARRDRVLHEIDTRFPLARRERPAYVSESCWDLISSLLERDPQHRPTAEEALLHPWLCSDKDQRSYVGGA